MLSNMPAMIACLMLVCMLGQWSVTDGMPMPTPATDMMTMDQIQHYLRQYHYLGSGMPDPSVAELYYSNRSMAIQMGVQIFQERYQRYGLQPTGQLDVATLELMNKSRCGVPDINNMSDMMDMKRKRRYVLSGSQWGKTHLTYRISAYTRDMTRRDVDREIRRAFSVWEDVTPLRFTIYNPSIHNVLDIDIKFAESYNDHGDGFPFDGPGKTLAHAFFPGQGEISGDSHFDDAETWTLNTRSGTNLFQVAAHEFGHALGLRHSKDPSALMAPFYQGYIPDFRLPDDDRQGIQAIYGNGRTTTAPPTTPRPTTMRPVPPTSHPDFPVCRRPHFDAISTIRHSSGYKTYGFQGQYYFLLNDNGGIASGYPRLIRQGWPGLPNNIDAALFWDETVDPNNGQKLPAATFIFKGHQYWRVEDMTVVSGPDPISLWGLQTSIDAAFTWKRNGKTYFFKGNRYYRYTENQGIDPTYPKNIAIWRGLPRTGIDAAMQAPNGDTYFFNRAYYYLFNDNQVRVRPGYPRNNADYWLRCPRRRHNNEEPNRSGPNRRYPSRFS